MSTRETVGIYNYMKPKMKLQQWFKNLGGVAIAMVLAGQAWAATAINAITSGVQSGEIIVKVELSEPLTYQPQGFVIQNPARIALDLPGVINGMDRSSIDLNQGNLRAVQIAQANDRTRLVLSLGSVSTYSTEISGNTLLVRLAAPQSAAPAAVEQTSYSAEEVVQAVGETSQPAMPAVVQSSDLRNIDFRTSADGAGAVIVTLPSDQTAIDIRQQGNNVVVDILQTTLPVSLRRQLDVRDFRTPVQSITAEQAGSNVRLTVSPAGNWEQSAYQAGNQFVLELHPVQDDPNKLVPGTGYRGERLTLNFQNVEIRTLLNSLADFTDFNVVTSDSVSGSLTLRLKDVPWDQALEIIMQAKGLAYIKNGNVLWIAPLDEINNMREGQRTQQQASEALEPLRTQIFQLNYARAEALMEALKEGNTGNSSTSSSGLKPTSMLSARGTVLVDPRTNKLIVTDVPSRLENLAAVIGQIDVPVRQVVIEARIVEAQDGWGRSLGMRLSGLGIRGRHSVGGTMPIDDDSSSDSDDDDNRYTLEQDQFNFFNLPASNLLNTGVDPGYFAFRFNPGGGRYLQLELQALEAENYGRSIASPRLMTSDMVTAKMEQGVEIPYQEASSSGATSISFKEAVLGLEVTPRIMPNGNVSLDLVISQDTVGQNTLAGPSINTKRINTQVTVENGGTVVIGGIFTQTETSSVHKIPLLGDLPLIGNFFRSTDKSNQRTELLIFITPRIVNDGFNHGTGTVPNLGRQAEL